ncbi:hypothetical protein [Brevibacillus thermoruber]|uniref:hypothetical protein n=1 Tax=Brevibacillus thermoruber TaxID=33942 RepID=UPI000554D6F6|nr:hypothetical protein [Brevibacillus thermoruber]
MHEAIPVGKAFHFWLNEKDDVYDRLYGENRSNQEKKGDHGFDPISSISPRAEDISGGSEKE